MKEDGHMVKNYRRCKLVGLMVDSGSQKSADPEDTVYWNCEDDEGKNGFSE